MLFERWGFKFGKLIPKVKPRDLCKSWNIYRGDLVEVIAGKEKGKQGKVLEVLRKLNRVVVDGCNQAKRRYSFPDPGNPLVKGKTRTFLIERGIHRSHVALVNPSTGKPTTRIQWKQIDKGDGIKSWLRVARKTNTEIPYPDSGYKRPTTYDVYDTEPEEAAKVTFEPNFLQRPIPLDCIL